MLIDSPLTTIPRITAPYARKLERLGIKTVKDLLFHFPFRYEDYSDKVTVSQILPGKTVTIEGTVNAIKTTRTWKRKMYVTESLVSDETGTVRAVWFNQPFITDSLKKGRQIRLSGKITESAQGSYFSNPSWELSSRDLTNTGCLVPVYPETEGITSRWIRWQMQNIFKYNLALPDPVPEDLLKKLHLPSLSKALRQIHFPKSQKEYQLAQKRFAFEEMLLIQIKSLQVRASWKKETAVPIPFEEDLIKEFVHALPFTLTNAQRKASYEILRDLEKPRPMNRLLNGDVGSGKTIVAAIACLQTMQAGFQAAIMAPTEILARQHFEKIAGLLAPYSLNVALLTNAYKEIHPRTNFRQDTISSKDNFLSGKLPSTLTASSKVGAGVNREMLLKKIKKDEARLIIGTHALIQKDIRFHNLALVIVDEQHRFGIAQRAYLQQEARDINDGLRNKIPHFLTMTATPIPRTLALAFFGNLDLSVLDEMPKSRKKIITEIVSPREREKIYEFMRKEMQNGQQCFVILPLVEESEVLKDLKSSIKEHERLSKEIFPDMKVGLLHGRMKSEEKEKTMLAFKEKKIDILVSTSVVEVGIDIPNATVMVIEDADRFGLSQLHQFRGRVGRGEHQSYCFLFASANASEKNKRLQALSKNHDGFKIAEKDLELRGPGELFGLRQSGLPDIAMENLTNIKLIQIAKEEAEYILRGDPSLKNHILLKQALEKFEKKVHFE